MKTISICLTIVGAICWSCAVTDFDKTTDFAVYHSFGWGKSSLNVANPAYRSDLIEAHIKTTVKSEFAKKGIVYAGRKADLLVTYEGFIEKRELRSIGARIYYYPYYYPYYHGFFPYGGYMMAWPNYWSEPDSYYGYDQGTLILNVRERKTQKLIWRGLVRGNVDDLKSLNKNISKGIKAILKKYPVVPPPIPPLPKGKEKVAI